MTRPYFQTSIEELEREFESRGDEPLVLSALLNELNYRNTLRAARLRQRVQQRFTSAPGRLAASAERSAQQVEIPREETLQPEMPRVERLAPSEYPPITNTPEGVLSAWTALEVLSPPSQFTRPEDLPGVSRQDVVELTDNLPWDRGAKSKPKFKLFYQVALGSVKMEPAVARLIERYGDTRPDPPSPRGKKTILAAVLVDRTGRLIESPAVAISSFAWGVMAALDGQLTDLARWPVAEREIVESVEATLRRFTMDGDGEAERPLTREALLKTYQALIRDLRLPPEFVEPPTFAIRSYVWFKDPNPPEPPILNSFFLRDLAWARQLFAEGTAPEALQRYLGTIQPSKRIDLLRDEAELRNAVAPERTPLSRWPGRGRHSLVLLQQAAVNVTLGELTDGGILGVNGPPGTGKTTLLRDIVAGVVVQRAAAMVKFADPAAAFTHSGEKQKAGAAWLHLYHLDPSLRGFELVIASSNNKAVENVSAELPGLEAIADDAPQLRYFKGMADVVHDRETWGMIAAVLGNAQNRSRFRQTFWWNDDVSMNRYLAAAAGTPQFVEEKDPVTGTVRSRPPRVVAEEKPPTTAREAQQQWKAAQERFRLALQHSAQWRNWLEHVRKCSTAIPSLVEAMRASENAKAAAMIAENVATVALGTAEETRTAAEQAQTKARVMLDAHAHTKPGWLARLFRTARARAWRTAYLPIRVAFDSANQATVAATSQAKSLDADLTHATRAREAADTILANAIAAHEAALSELSEARSRGVVIADDEFFSTGHDAIHRTTPWYTDDAQRSRDEVFIAAMEVHRAFITAAAKSLRHNLGALMGAFSGQGLTTEKKRLLLPDLWGSLFLVVPMISTTFASVERMLGLLPPQSFGWLLVDEAGQALPQAAVGALIRTRKALVIGDPMQIEPVVSLPELLTTAVCRQMGVDPNRYAAPAASVQTLADSASSYASEFETRSGSRNAGVPLLVHRRCAEPMFGISNAIAYAGLMVSAKKPLPSTIRDVLGSSRWFHVEGAPQEKWCAEEGAEVLRLLRKLTVHRLNPNLFIITPFVIVADRLRQLVRDSGVLTEFGVEQAEHWKWASDRIGTVHTVQGREAEAVIFVLGAPSPSQVGARNWAGGRPNLLNVATTRAKEALYVIGNRELWREAGLFSALDQRLPA